MNKNILVIVIVGVIVFSVTACAEKNSIIKLNNDSLVKEPIPLIQGDRWWSSVFFNTHKKIAQKSFSLISKNDYPDLFYYKDKLIDGASDEDGHPTKKDNGGYPYDIWFSTKELNNGKEIGVLYKYFNKKFEDAYENIGIICHLTQDQAVPTHAANIEHSFFDQFERYYGENENIDISNFSFIFPSYFKPWDYYQYVQDDTRRHLNEWLDPETKIPYWQSAKDAPPLGKDSTMGPHGQYGGGKDHFTTTQCENNYSGNYECKSVPKSPEIGQRQIAMAIFATASLLESASRNLPPIIDDFQIINTSIRFKILENRCNVVSYSLSNSEHVERSANVVMDAKSVPFEKDLSIDLKLKGRYKLSVIDCDNNVSIKEFNIK
ncbi:MAG: hypothetical protein GX445_07740 [Elusimicrobia bacterium]|nr:hypothetical protein [Elusimicrobiota bacterium]